MPASGHTFDRSKTRPTLIRKLRDWDDSLSWGAFYDAYGGIIYSMALRKGLSHQEADEARQNTMLAVAKAIGSFEYDAAKGGFRRWLCTIASRRIAEILHRKIKVSRLEASLDDMEDHLEIADSQDDSISDDEWQRARLQLILGNLREVAPPLQLQIFDLRHNHGWDRARIAKELRVTRARVSLELFRFRARMREAESHLKCVMPE